MKHSIASVGIACLAAIAPLEAKAASFSQMYVFGDSLSDAGNLFRTTFGTVPQTPPYAQRLSNGPVWVEYLADDLGLSLVSSTEVSLSSTAINEGINFAFGGAGTGEGNIVAPLFTGTGVLAQIEAFTELFSAPSLQPASDALYVYLAGANDLAGSEAVPPQTNISVPLQNTSIALQQLIDAGAQNILLGKLPDFSITPLFNERPAVELAAISNLVSAYNAELAKLVDEFMASDPLVNFIEFDFNELLTEATANPTQFGFTNTTQPCLGDYTFPFDPFFTVCDNPDEYLFWDDFHPTTQVHQLVAQAALSQIEAQQQPPESIPEPAMGWGLLLLSAAIAHQLSSKRHQPSAIGDSRDIVDNAA